MADAQANIAIGVDTSQALAGIRQLQREISAFHTSMAKGGALASANSARLSQNLVNTVNATGQFSAGMTRIQSGTESFTNALEKNKLSMGQYFRFAGGASRNFGKMFSREFSTINRVATERVKDLQTQYISMGRDANGALQSIKVRPLALNMDNLGTRVQMVAQKQQLFNQLLRQGSTNLLNFGKNTQWAGRQLMVGFTIPLTIFGALAIKEFQKIEEQAVKFRRVYGDMFVTSGETDKALSNVRELAEEFTKYGIAIEKTVGLAAKVAQMGNVGTDLIQQVTQATRLSVLGGIEQEEALDTTISLTNAFGIAAEDLAGKIAFLNAAENQTILAIEDFNTAIPLSGSVVRQLGGDVEDLAVLLTAMREGGINASQAGNALKSSLGRLIAPSRNAKKVLGEFGIDVMGIVNNNAGDLMGTINTLAFAFEKLDPLGRARSIEALFGKFQFARMSTMFQNIVKEGSQANKVLGLAANSTAELAIIAERELKAVEQSPAFKLKKQMEELKASLAPIGEEFVKAIGPLLEFGNRLLKSFNNLGEGGKQFVVILTSLAGVVAPAVLMVVGLVANGIANLIKFVALLGRGFARLSGSSRILGTGTAYMTQEQIEAATVAASLGHSHSRLIQVFTAETTAVRNLAAAYRQAIVAQSGFRGAAMRGQAPGPVPQKLAKGGIIRGPGTGTSDSIMAMLSHGEAVIPAAAVRENPQAVNQLISGNIPGFSEGGTVNVLGKNISTDTNLVPLERLANRLNSISRMIPGILEDFTDSLVDGGKMAASTMKTKLNELAEEQRRLIGLAEYTEAGGGSDAQTGMVGGHTGGKEQVGPQAAKKLAGSLSPGEARRQMEASDGGTLHSEMVLGITAQENAHKGREEELSLLTGEERAGFYKDPQNQKMAGSYLEDGGYIDLEDPVQAADFSVFTTLLAAKLEAAGAKAVSEADFGTLVGEARSEMPEGKAKTGMERAENTYKTFNPAGPDKKRYNLPTGESIVRDPETRELAHSTAAPGGSYQQRGAKLRPQFAERAETAALKNVKGAAESQGYDTTNLDALIQEARSAGADTGQGVIDGYSDTMQIASPSKRMFGLGKNSADSLADGFEQGMADKTGKPPLPGNLAEPKAPPLPGLAPPPPPEVGYMPDDNSLRSRVRGLGKRVADKAADSSIGKFAGKKLAQASGNAVTDSKGKVFYDPNKDPNSVFGKMEAKAAADRARLPGGANYSPDIPDVAGGAPLPVRVVDGFEMDPQFQETMESGQIQTEDLSETLAKNVETTDQNTKTSKEVIKTDKRQRRMGTAGKTLGALGGLTMAAGMATQAPGVIGETAQKIVGPLAALTGIAPMLIGLGPVLGSLVAIIALVVAGFFMYNKAMKDAARETYELQRAMGSSREAIQSFAEFSGKVTQTEIFKKQQEERFNPFQIGAGKTTFGENFAVDEAGQALVGNIRTSLTELGRDQTVTSMFLQLGQAVGEGALSIPEARSIATELGDQLGDMSFGMEVNANLMRLLGPGGEDLLAGDRLTILADLREERGRTRAEMDLEYSPITGREQRTVGSDANVARSEIVESLGGGFGGTVAAFFTSGEWHKLTFDLATGIGAAKENMAQLGSILAQGVNDADAYAAEMAAVEAVYGESLAKAYSMGDEYEIERLEAEKSAALQKLIDLRKQSQDQVITELSKDIPKTRIAMKEALAVEFGDDEAALKQYTGALKQIQGLGLEDSKSLELEYMLTSGDMPFQTAMAIVENYETLPAVSTKIMEIQTNFGDLSGDATGLFNTFKSIDEDLAEEFVLQLDTSDLARYQKQIEGFGAISRIQGLFPEGEEILLDVALKDEKVLDRILENTAKLEGLDNQAITLDFISNTFGEEALNAAATIWDTIPTEDRKDALYSILTALDLDLGEGYDDLFESLKGQIIAGVTINKPGDILSLIGARTAGVAAGNRDLDTGPEETPTGGGAEPQVDSLIKKLRDLRLATIDMKKGWEGMQQALESVFAGGTKAINVFEGLSNQIRRMGVGESLIEMIVGMDPDEYNKRKNELFIFDAAGNIVETTAKLKNMNSAFNAIAIGEYINSQQSFIENTNNQFTAMQKLTAEGLSFVKAYEMVQDQALATAIAMGITREETAELIRIIEMMTEMREKYNRISEEEKAAKAVKQTNKEFNNRVAVLNKLASQQGKYTDEEINAILNDSNLSTLFLNPTIDPKSLGKALENARRAADLELRIKVSTEEGKKGLFDELVGGVQDEFGRQETKIDIDFRLATRDDQDIASEAQNQIAAIRYQIDDYEAQLKGIEDQEEVINEKYEDRHKALEEVAKVNERIQRIRGAELDIADALSRGDIAAAAKAQEQLRAAQAQNAAESEKEMLQRQQEAELARLRSKDGSSREELEDKIKGLQDSIFDIEEESLEPAQERLRIAEYNKQLQIDALEVSGRTRNEWDQIANLTDIATQNTEEFAKNVERALALYEHFVNGAPLDVFGLFAGHLEALKDMGVSVGEQAEQRLEAVAAQIAGVSYVDEDDAQESVQSRKLTDIEVIASYQRLNEKVSQMQAEINRASSPVGGSSANIEELQRELMAARYGASALRTEVASRGYSPDHTRVERVNAGPESLGRIVDTRPPPTHSRQSSSGNPENTGSRASSSSTAATAAASSVQRAAQEAYDAPTPAAQARLRAAQMVQDTIRKTGNYSSAYLYGNTGGLIQRYAIGGTVRMASGGKVARYANGGYSLGSDTIPAMLTPGEFVVRKRAVQDFGVDNLEAINSGEYSSGSVYNYSLAVNVRSEADPNKIAKTVMREIKRVDSQRVRGNRI